MRIRALHTLPLLAALASAACFDREPLRPPAAPAGNAHFDVVPDLSGPIESPYGINAGTFGRGVEETDQTKATAPVTAQYAADAGIGWVRLDFGWTGIQANNGTDFDFSKHDYQVALAASHGMKVLATLSETPNWARTTLSSNVPRDWNEWENFVNRTVAHYDSAFPGVVTHWGVWNEPDDPGFWNGTTSQYITLLNHAATAIHAHGDKVVAPELGGTANARDFLASVLNASGSQVDIVSVHKYSANVLGPQGIVPGVEDDAILTNLTGTVWHWPIWLTEAAQPSAKPDTIADSTQARVLRDIYSGMQTTKTAWWEKSFFFALLDVFPDTSGWVWDTGITSNEWLARNQRDPSLIGKRQAWYDYRTETSTRFAGANVGYRAHLAYNGWQPEVFNGRIAGMTQQTASLSWATPELQALQVRLNNLPAGTGVAYQVDIKNQGWQVEKHDGQMAGTTGQNLPIDAIKLHLTSPPSGRGICYQVYLSTGSWQPEVCNGTAAGTPGGATILALKIRIVTNPLSATVQGSHSPPRNSFQTYSASVSGGVGPYTYQWYRNGVQQSGETNGTYLILVGTTSFNVSVRVTDANGYPVTSPSFSVTPCSLCSQ